MDKRCRGKCVFNLLGHAYSIFVLSPKKSEMPFQGLQQMQSDLPMSLGV